MPPRASPSPTSPFERQARTMSSDTTTTRTGRCLCGEVTYEISGDPIATAVCHCEHCQRQSGGAFSVNVVMPASPLTISGTLQTYENTNEDEIGRASCRERVCTYV